jgi:D-alanyl-D-alanine carboxypeptidase
MKRAWIAIAASGCLQSAAPSPQTPTPQPPAQPPAPVQPVISTGPPGATHDDLTAQLEAVRAAERLPALGAAVWRSGKLVAEGVTGVRELGDATRATLDDQWHLGSDTKAMTATLVGLYIDRGVLHWNDTIAKLFPDVAVSPGYAQVTIDQLLAHRGGAPADIPADLMQMLWSGGGAVREIRQRFVAALVAQPTAQQPGTFAYSNAGYIILGAMVERATGQSWEQVMQGQLFAALAMTSCGFGAPTGAQPWGHRRDGTPMSPDARGADNPPALGPAGTVHCSLADWGKFLSAHAAPASTLLSTTTFQHLHSGEGYMAGWGIVSFGPGDTRLAHEGSNTMWRAIAILIPKYELAFAVVANQDDDRLSRAIAPVLESYVKQAATAPGARSP